VGELVQLRSIALCDTVCSVIAVTTNNSIACSAVVVALLLITTSIRPLLLSVSLISSSTRYLLLQQLVASICEPLCHHFVVCLFVGCLFLPTNVCCLSVFGCFSSASPTYALHLLFTTTTTTTTTRLHGRIVCYSLQHMHAFTMFVCIAHMDHTHNQPCALRFSSLATICSSSS
jgi:hypothetical protein